MKRIITYTICFLISIGNLCGQGGLRAAYEFYHKTSPESGYFTQPDMMTDYAEGKSVFYSDATYHRDSLSTIAFDSRGEIRDSEAYRQIQDFRGGSIKDVAFLDFTAGKIVCGYRKATVFIIGEGDLTTPHWTLTSESRTSSNGLTVKKATADYLGRHWIIWYCEDIPIPSGPWLLWGAPGLITYASDSENLFCFKLLYFEEIEISRYDMILNYYNNYHSGNTRRFTYPLWQAEKVNNQAERDLSYTYKLAGVSDSEVQVFDQRGNRKEFSNTRNHIPLIHEKFLK